METQRLETSQQYLHILTTALHKPEAEILAQVFQVGLRQLWREYMLGQYLRHEISRTEAIDAVGIDWVELAERQYQAAMEDVTWGLNT